MVRTNCCVCGLDDAAPVGLGEDFEYRTTNDSFLAVRCKSCGLVYLNPRPSVEDIPVIYPSDYHAFDFSVKNFGLVHNFRSRLEARRLLKICRDLGDGACILDVGCGDAFHLKLLRAYGNKQWILEGVDIDERAAEAGREAGITIHAGSVVGAELPEQSYDLVLMIQTIEHVERPDIALAAVRKLLKPGGKLLIVTDNTDSIDFGIFKDSYWGGYHFPRHWNLFNKGSLRKLAANTGFEVESLKTLVSPVNWTYSIHNTLAAWNSPRFLASRFTLHSIASLAAFTVLDFGLQKLGRGALLKAVLRKAM